jgi:hypothetical protein
MSDYDRDETDLDYRERLSGEHQSSGDRSPIGRGYTGYYGSVDEQPDNPQDRYTDDD